MESPDDQVNLDFRFKILNKTHQINKHKTKTIKSRNPGIKRFIPGNGAKECRRPYAHLGLTWKKSSIHWVRPWGRV